MFLTFFVTDFFVKSFLIINCDTFFLVPPSFFGHRYSAPALAYRLGASFITTWPREKRRGHEKNDGETTKKTGPRQKRLYIEKVDGS